MSALTKSLMLALALCTLYFGVTFLLVPDKAVFTTGLSLLWLILAALLSPQKDLIAAVRNIPRSTLAFACLVVTVCAAISSGGIADRLVVAWNLGTFLVFGVILILRIRHRAASTIDKDNARN